MQGSCLDSPLTVHLPLCPIKVKHIREVWLMSRDCSWRLYFSFEMWLSRVLPQALYYCGWTEQDVFLKGKVPSLFTDSFKYFMFLNTIYKHRRGRWIKGPPLPFIDCFPLMNELRSACHRSSANNIFRSTARLWLWGYGGAEDFEL